MTHTTQPQSDRHWMQQCLELARQAAGYTSPNPMVGAVVVKEEKLVGAGYHPGAGQPHAEVFALREAGDAARNATLYVNLEPCNHTGRTPPCTEAILAAGIAHVVVGTVDPDPRVSGSGIERLRQAGLEVTVGVEEAACRQLNEAFIYSVQYQRPFGILKYAMTLDGKIAAEGGHSAWVTSSTARSWVHRLRGTCDAVIVGGQTVRRDNPHLTSHGQSDRNPLRVVMSRQLNLPEQANLWASDVAQTIVFCETHHDPAQRQHLEKLGVEVVVLLNLSPANVLEYLHQRGLRNVLWECGGTLSANAIAQHCVQKVCAFIAPKIVGGQDAPTPVGALGISLMHEAHSLTDITVKTVGPDILIQGYLPEP